nr:immunoglobulin heavy chain junction region [Macaca mulatta]MOY21700.1 immunoglobulin heavy chain junction region [Macaca mulatta]MOY21821.1 immunoglobulin heavy chain junction region [Macaca mulatta]MOY22011.1 immunoglobulin heavy chain junction region [Macaca mulatta]MOY22409.1 immunoglobulin heavy chain junction region [Macaca mulatta]
CARTRLSEYYYDRGYYGHFFDYW